MMYQQHLQHQRRYSNESDDTMAHSVSSHDGSYDGGSADEDTMMHNQRRKDKKQRRIRKIMTSLQLPQQRYREIPTLRILVVANVDLQAASNLAEAALGEVDNPLRHVDLCIACGPFCRPDELNRYYQGRQLQLRSSRYHHHPYDQQQQHQQHQQQHQFNAPLMSPPPLITSPFKQQQQQQDQHNNNSKRKAKKSREEIAALEGLMTAALSQLESIVCRVSYVPGTIDPIIQNDKRRLTPNSRNLHNHWMPVGPGLGCAGWLHMDWEKHKQEQAHLEDNDNDDDDDEADDYDDDEDDLIHQSLPPLEDNSDSISVEDDEVSSSDDYSEGAPYQNSSVTVTPEKSFQEQYSLDFCHNLEKLVSLAPPMSAVTDLTRESQSHPTIHGLQTTDLFQTILVTQYQHLIHCDSVLPPEHDKFISLPLVQEHVALEICAGPNSQGQTPAPEIKEGSDNSNMKLLFPGSLKERGEYCLVDIAFTQNDTSYECEWTVQNTQFLTL